MPKACKDALKAASIEESQHQYRYKIDVENAVASLVGYKSNAMVATAKEVYKNAPIKKNKKKIKVAESMKKEHSELYNLMTNYFMESGEQTNYSRDITNPTQMVEDWKLIFAKHLRGEMNPLYFQQGIRTARATKNLIKRIVKKRNNILKAGKLSKRDVFILPPEFIAAHADRYGIIGKVIAKALRLGDKDIQATSKYSTQFDNIRVKITDSLMNLVQSSNKALFNLNNSSMWGIKGFRTLDKSEDIVIVGEEVQNGVDGYIIKGEPNKWTPKSNVNATPIDVLKGLVGLYRDELINELADGQVRYIIPSLLDSQVDENGYLVNKDFAGVKNKIKLMAKKRESGNRIGGVHTKVVKVGKKQWEYRYVMVKQGESSIGEQYNAYLLDKAQIGSNSKRIEGSAVNFVGKNHKILFGKEVITDGKYTQIELDSVLDKGFYRSEKINDFGRLIRTKGRGIGTPINGTHTKQYIDFNYMPQQPNKAVIEEVWEGLFKTRGLFNRIFLDIQNKLIKIENKRQILHHKISKQLIASGLDAKGVEEHFKNLYETGGVDSRVWFDKETGNIRTINTFMKKKEENYIPHMYEKGSIVFEQIPKQIMAMETKLSRAKQEGLDERVKELKSGIKTLKQLAMSYTEEDQSNSIVDLSSIAHLKHITEWTDQTKRRKDGDIYHDYLSGMYRNIHRNEIIVDMLQSLHSLQKLGNKVPQGITEYLVNRVKLTFGDSDTRAISITGKETGHADLAAKLNQMPKWARGGTSFTAKSAERFVKWLTTPTTMRFLGGSPALTNNTQLVNFIIQVGFKTAAQAHKIMKSYPEKWKKIIQNTGVLNVLTMFSEVMLQDGDVNWNDFGFYPGTIIPSGNMREFIRLLAKGRDNFIKNGDANIDNFLRVLEAKSTGKTKEQLRELQKLDKLRHALHNDKLKEKRGEFFDIFALGKDQSEKIIESRFKKLIGDVSDSKLKRMVSWKLSWWFDGLVPGEEYLTFTKGEERMRSMTIVMAMLDAQKRGMLNGSLEDLENGKGYEVFDTQLAIKIARDAVYNTQFGMTPPYIGEGFNGLGRAIWQYKQYPTLQMIHDYQIWKKFTDGNHSNGDGIARIVKAIAQSTTMIYKKTIKGDKTATYDPTSQLDHEAIAMARFLFTRGMASLVASTIGLVPFLGYILRKGGGVGFGMLRGAENPALGMVMRLAIWSSLFAMGADDDDRDRKLDDLFGSMQMFVLPVFLGTLARDVTTSWDYVNKDD